MSTYLAFDLGAESGRAILGTIADGRLSLEQVHRFPNVPVRVGNRLHWDVLRLYQDIKDGIALAARQALGRLAGIGIDTWAVDFGLLGRHDELLGNPYHYRDPATTGMMARAFKRVSREEIFFATGIQFLPFNTLYQLMAMQASGSPLLANAESLLMMGELFTFFLTGEKVGEYTNASTTQCLNVQTRTWDRALLSRLDLPASIMPPLVQPGTVVGALRPSVSQELGLNQVPVIVPAVHDTGSAVAAVPAASPADGSPGSAGHTGPNWAYLSSGTWSLLGVELHAPIVDAASLAYNFTNEGGVAGTIRFLKNIMGLWLVQECRRSWAAAGRTFTYDQITTFAAAARPFRSLIDPDDSRFLAPNDMPTAIQAYCRETGQPVPQTEGELARCCYESLALKYRLVLEQIEAVTGSRTEVLHVVGGGSQNRLLNQMTADATGIPVIAGPVEATALGNVMLQAIATGEIASVAEGRALIRNSVSTEVFTPMQTATWTEAFGRWRTLAGA